MNPKTGQCEPKNQKGTSNTSSGCQEGFHQHAGYKNCHEIWKPHKPNTLSCNQHRLLGIPCRYKGEKLDADGRPVDKGIPTRAWLKQAKEKEGKGENKENESKPKSSIDTVYSDIPNMLADDFKKVYGYEKVNDTVSALRDVLKDEELSTSDLRTKFEGELKNLGISMSADLNSDYIRDLYGNIVNTMETYPMGALVLDGIGQKVGEWGMCFSPLAQTIYYNELIYCKDGAKLGEKYDYSEVYDPETKKAEKWGFHHFSGSNISSFTHEYGHLMNHLLILLSTKNNSLLTSTPKFAEGWNEKKKEISQDLEDLDFVSYVSLSTDHTDTSISLRIKVKDADDKFTKDSDYHKKVFEVLEKYGLREAISTPVTKPKHTYGRNPEYYVDVDISCPPIYRSHIAEPSQELVELISDCNDNLSFKKLLATETFEDNRGNMPMKDIIINLVQECESLYKEMYNVEKIIPSDVYSGYGYLGSSTRLKKWRDNKKYTSPEKDRYEPEKTWRGTRYASDILENASEERVAEAFADVMARGEKANSMSTLLVRCVEYNIHRYLSGEKKTFTEYMREKLDFSTIGEPIVKLKVY